MSAAIGRFGPVMHSKHVRVYFPCVLHPITETRALPPRKVAGTAGGVRRRYRYDIGAGISAVRFFPWLNLLSAELSLPKWGTADAESKVSEIFSFSLVGSLRISNGMKMRARARVCVPVKSLVC